MSGLLLRLIGGFGNNSQLGALVRRTASFLLLRLIAAYKYLTE